MRTEMVGLGVLMCLSAAVAAGGRSVTPVKQPNLSATALRTLQAGLPPTALQSLGGTITRQQQLQMLGADPGIATRLRKLGAGIQTQPMGGDPWSTGVTVAPLTPLYPTTATYSNFQVSLQSHAVWLSEFSPLPTATQNPPLLWLSVGANSDPLFWLEVHWPSTGAYMMTFFVKDGWPLSTAKPRVFKFGEGMVTTVANTPSGGDRWTVLWEAGNASDLDENVVVYPPESGFGFTTCCLSKVVISRLQ